MGIVTQMPKTRDTGEESTAEFTSQRKHSEPSENIYSYAKPGETEMEEGYEIKHLPWQILPNSRADAMFVRNHKPLGNMSHID
jgi:hypothetical protein